MTPSDQIVPKDNFAVLTGTTGSTVGSVLELNYPTGYTYSNSVVIGLQFYASNVWRTFGALNADTPCVITATMESTKILVVLRTLAGALCPVKVVLFRYTT